MNEPPLFVNELPLFDMHCHLGFAENARKVAEGLATKGGGALCATVKPAEYLHVRSEFAGNASVPVGLGLHPWWIDDGRCGEKDVALCVKLADEARFIAEVGLDFGKRCAASCDTQLDAFQRICAAAGSAGDKVLSLHAVNAAAEVLDVLQETACLAPDGKGSCTCILHWYSGSSDQLHRAVTLGCFFSINPRMLQTKRGREYARILPADRLLLETDLPPSAGGAFDPNEIPRVLAQTLADLEALRNEPLAARIAATSRELLNWHRTDL